MTTPSAADPATKRNARLPLFYRRIEPLNLAQHGKLKLRHTDRHLMARGAGLIPLTLVEFPVAGRQYPIVFLPPAGGQPPAAVIAAGTHPAENLFVSTDGEWMPGFYVPAYLRRYPFITGNTKDDERKAVFIDVDADRLSTDEGAPLYEDGELSKAAKSALDFCGQYHTGVQRTAAFTAALHAAEILVPSAPAGIDLPPGQKAAQFLAIDEQKLAAVDDEIFLLWRKQGWIAPIYLHLISLGNFAALAELKKRRAMAGPAPAGHA